MSISRVITLSWMVLFLGSCTTQPSEPPAIWSKDYQTTSCSDWVTQMSDAQRHTVASHFLSVFAGTVVAPSAIPDEETTRPLVISITNYCSRPESDIVAGLGSRALLLSAAAAFSLQTPVGTQPPP